MNVREENITGFEQHAVLGGDQTKAEATGGNAALGNHVPSVAEHRGVGLQVRGLRKSYDGHEVLRGINFEVNPGEIFVIMGPSGCGKTVLLRQLIGLETPDQGEIRVEGQMLQPPEPHDPLPCGAGVSVWRSVDLSDCRTKRRILFGGTSPETA